MHLQYLIGTGGEQFPFGIPADIQDNNCSEMLNIYLDDWRRKTRSHKIDTDNIGRHINQQEKVK